MGREARVLIIGQAPGSKVHASGVPWRDDSGDRWEETAHAWAHLARETPMSARMDLVVYWNLAAEAATKARARSAPGAAAFPWGDGR